MSSAITPSLLPHDNIGHKTALLLNVAIVVNHVSISIDHGSCIANLIYIYGC